MRSKLLLMDNYVFVTDKLIRRWLRKMCHSSSNMFHLVKIILVSEFFWIYWCTFIKIIIDVESLSTESWWVLLLCIWLPPAEDEGAVALNLYVFSKLANEASTKSPTPIVLPVPKLLLDVPLDVFDPVGIFAAALILEDNLEPQSSTASALWLFSWDKFVSMASTKACWCLLTRRDIYISWARLNSLYWAL